MKTHLQIKGEGAPGLVVAASGPHEQFLGLAWQLWNGRLRQVDGFSFSGPATGSLPTLGRKKKGNFTELKKLLQCVNFEGFKAKGQNRH